MYGLHRTDTKDIIEDLKKLNVTPIEVVELKTNGSNLNNATYAVNLNRGEVSMASLKNIRAVLHVCVRWAPYSTKFRGPTQCRNCTKYEHGAETCHRKPICALCTSSEHTTSAETMLNKNHKFYLPDFTTYRADREQHGGGVAICIRKSINHRLLPHTNTEHIENITIAVNIDNREIMLTSAYCPRFGAQFTNDIKKLTPLHKEFMVFGDLNAKHSAWRCSTSNASGKALMDSLLLRNFNIHFSANLTHYPHSGAAPSTLDILLTNSQVHISPLIAYEDELSSDHAPVVCIIDADVETRDRSIIYHFDRANWIAYKIHVNNSINRQAEFTNVNEIENGLELLVGAMHSAKERSVPIAFKQNKMFSISSETKRLITERNALKRQWLRCSNTENRRLLKHQINSTNREIS